MPLQALVGKAGPASLSHGWAPGLCPPREGGPSAAVVLTAVGQHLPSFWVDVRFSGKCHM